MAENARLPGNLALLHPVCEQSGENKLGKEVLKYEY